MQVELSSLKRKVLDFSQPIPFQVTDVVLDMSNEDYHAHGGEVISSSFVKNLLKGGSVGHALKPFTGNTKALEFGTAFHDRMEGNDLVVICDADQRTKEYKSVKADNPDSIVLKSSEVEALELMKQNTVNNEAYQSLFQYGEPVREWSVFATYNGIRYRVRFDLGFCNGDRELKNIVALADYKTTKSLKDFQSDLERSVKYKSGWRYEIQSVMYSDMVGIDPTKFYFIAVEKEYPYASGVYSLSEESVQKARADIYHAFHLIEDWKETGNIGSINNNIIVI